MYRQRRVAVVMPGYNVAAYVVSAVEAIPTWVDHIIVVDDGSDDATPHQLACIQRSGLVALRHQRNRGVGAAIATGYAEALERGAQLVVVMAGDGQMDPADLPALLDPVVDGVADYAKGNRFAHPDVWRVMPRARLLGNLILSLLTKLTSGYRKVFDSQCGYTAASDWALRAVGSTFFGRYGYPNDLLARLQVVGARVVDVPVRPVYTGQPSGIGFWTVLHPILLVLALSFVRRLRAQRKTSLRPGVLACRVSGRPVAVRRLGRSKVSEIESTRPGETLR
jgi:glycosyltransferase involved in cell wall biosynthesis